jgi:endonuclease/exonuclease/phosphatase family metal-dependent hydrolase
VPVPTTSRLRLGTFNLLHGLSLADGGARESELRDAVARTDADILGLQEVDRFQDRSGGVDQAAVAADALGATWWRFTPAVDGTPGVRDGWAPSTADDGLHTSGPTYGVALVSRFPVLDWRVRRFAPAPVSLPLLVPGGKGFMSVDDEPRVAIAAVVEGPRGPMTVVTAHLSFVPGWNVAQLRWLARWARSFPGPRFIAGDFNLPGAMPRVATRWAQLARAATYPSYRPRVQFDHVLADGIAASAVRGSQAMRLPVSDHCALVVDLDV